MKIEELSTIADRVREIRLEHNNLLRIGVAYSKEVGDLFLKAKPFLGRQWGKWLATEFDMTTECARRYLTVAKYWHRVEKHEMFPNMGLCEMYDVARERPIRKRSYKLIGCRLDTLLKILDERLADKVAEFPELEALIDAIDAARHVMEEAGLLRSGVERRKSSVRLQKVG